MFLHVISVDYLKGYQLRLTFSNEEVRIVDLLQEIHGEIFEPLQDIGFFRQVAINSETNTIEWPNGADFAPEFLYNLGSRAQQIA
ncbi:MAG: DUF2442 domain-containing protein [Leptolyngbya sp. SIO1E4]|nr:DUF2442 domain-containing protein [Leptolyngbya sp. SIO1E4]